VGSNSSFIKQFSFGADIPQDGLFQVTSRTLYSEELGYGFMTESNILENDLFQIPELNSAFTLAPDFTSKQVTNIITESTYCYSDKNNIPLVFKVKVPSSGNYHVTLSMGALQSETKVTVFSERRRCVLLNQVIKPGEILEHRFTANVCEIIPRGKRSIYQDNMLDIAIVGKKPLIKKLIVESTLDIPTLYLAGDSTVTDQGADYPYDPVYSYCGWGQMLPLLFSPEIAISNHAHSGLSTESFKPHWEIVEKNIKPGDWFFIQFGHNDQKRSSLAPFGGYAENLRYYVKNVKAQGAYPVIISPVSRTLWNKDGSFNDLLRNYAEASRQVAEEMAVPFIDLHARSVELIKKFGPQDSLRFFYPGDFTHFNDFGGFEMAKLVYQELLAQDVKPLVNYLKPMAKDELKPVLPSTAAESILDKDGLGGPIPPGAVHIPLED